jgi:hypothetical protein
MKKNYSIALISASILLGSSFLTKVDAANDNIGKQSKKNNSIIQAKGAISQETSSNRAVIWTNDLSVPADWTISNSSGNADNWVIGTGVPAGTFPIAGIASTSAANGFALFDSDLLCSGNQNAHLTTAQSIDCSAHPGVILKFEENYRNFFDSTFVEVSTNGTSWTKFQVNSNFATNQSSTNPQVVSLNITSVAGNQATVWIRFTFYSTTAAFGTNGGCAYAWMVDDISLEDAPDFDLQIGNTFSTEYSRVPLEQVQPFSFSGYVSNQGGASQSDAALKATVSAPLFSDSSAVVTLNPGQSDSLFIVNTFTPNAIGTLNVTMTAKSGQIDANPGDNSKTFTVNVTDSIYARDNGKYTGNGLFNGLTGTDGNAYVIGNLFEIQTDAFATSVSFAMQGTTDAGTIASVKIYDFSGTDPVEIGSSADYTIQASQINTTGSAAAPNLNPKFVTIKLTSPVQLTSATKFYVAAVSYVGGLPLVLASGTDFEDGLGAFLYDTDAATPEWFLLGGTPMVRLNVHNTVGVGELDAQNITLVQNQPNPFNSQTTIQYTLTEASNVSFTVTDLAGRIVRVIENQNLSAGNHNIVLNAADFAAGAYNYTLTSNGKSVTKKMFVTK